MKNLLLLFGFVGIFVFSGCSSRSQINPSPNGYKMPKVEKEFNVDQKLKKLKEAYFKKGEKAGYENAKKEVAKIIPYLEAIRASAELYKAGGICLPPLFIDKKNKSSVKIIVGKAHICDNFTVNDVFRIVKSGIPGLPNEYVKKSSLDRSVNVKPAISGIKIAGSSTPAFFARKPSDTKAPYVIKVKDTYTNRQILRNSNLPIGEFETDQNGYIIISFKNKVNAHNFCKQYTICKK